jgi:hypothetical protein
VMGRLAQQGPDARDGRGAGSWDAHDDFSLGLEPFFAAVGGKIPPKADQDDRLIRIIEDCKLLSAPAVINSRDFREPTLSGVRAFCRWQLSEWRQAPFPSRTVVRLLAARRRRLRQVRNDSGRPAPERRSS